MAHPPRRKPFRFKTKRKAKKSSRVLVKKPVAEVAKETPPDKSVWDFGRRVRVIGSWKEYNTRFIGRVGYVVERLPVQATYDVKVKFLNHYWKHVDVELLRSLPGATGDFRISELKVIG